MTHDIHPAPESHDQDGEAFSDVTSEAAEFPVGEYRLTTRTPDTGSDATQA